MTSNPAERSLTEAKMPNLVQRRSSDAAMPVPAATQVVVGPVASPPLPTRGILKHKERAQSDAAVAVEGESDTESFPRKPKSFPLN